MRFIECQTQHPLRTKDIFHFFRGLYAIDGHFENDSQWKRILVSATDYNKYINTKLNIKSINKDIMEVLVDKKDLAFLSLLNATVHGSDMQIYKCAEDLEKIKQEILDHKNSFDFVEVEIEPINGLFGTYYQFVNDPKITYHSICKSKV